MKSYIFMWWTQLFFHRNSLNSHNENSTFQRFSNFSLNTAGKIPWSSKYFILPPSGRAFMILTTNKFSLSFKAILILLYAMKHLLLPSSTVYSPIEKLYWISGFVIENVDITTLWILWMIQDWAQSYHCWVILLVMYAWIYLYHVQKY